MNPIQKKWDDIYQNLPDDLNPEPAFGLKAYDFLLPRKGLAIDLACGTGGNALFLAKRGLQTQAWDLSPVVLARLHRVAEQNGLDLVCEVRDLEKSELPKRCYDVVVITRYLNRDLNKQVVDALKPGGLLYFQTFVLDKDPAVGPRNPDYLLGENELLSMFPGLVVRVFCEIRQVGQEIWIATGTVKRRYREVGEGTA